MQQSGFKLDTGSRKTILDGYKIIKDVSDVNVVLAGVLAQPAHGRLNYCCAVLTIDLYARNRAILTCERCQSGSEAG